MQIFDGSTHVNPSGVHCSAIHLDGVAQTCTHKIVALFPQHRLHGLGLVVFVFSNIWNIRAPISVNRNQNRS
jgi:hypothetical protein